MKRFYVVGALVLLSILTVEKNFLFAAICIVAAGVMTYGKKTHDADW